MDYSASTIFEFDQQQVVHHHDHVDELIQFSSQYPYQDLLITSNNYPVSATTGSASTEKQESKKQLRRKAAGSSLLATNESPNEIKKKKVLHKEVERQRRQEMTTLYNSLRSHLPLEHLKGKRSISDHMHEAMNYIKHMKKTIEELKHKKDGLTRISNRGFSTDHNVDLHDSSSSFCSRNEEFFLSVKHCLVGVEIVISIDLKREGLQLSKVFEIIIAEGLDVVNCMSTKANNDRFIYTIQSEVNNGRRIILSDLQQKLENLLIG